MPNLIIQNRCRIFVNAREIHSPKQIPDPPTGGFDIQLSGGSHVPEKPPGPPHASPSVLAHILQHLKGKIRINFRLLITVCLMSFKMAWFSFFG
jgi:hypothetical protein